MVTDTAVPIRSSNALAITIASALGVAVAFVVAIVDFAALDAGTLTRLTGLDAAIAIPSVAWSVVFFAVMLTFAVSYLAGARLPHALHVAAIVVAALGTLYQLAAVVFGVSWYTLVLLILALATLYFTIRACRASKTADVAPQIERAARTWVLGAFLVIAGAAGLLAAYSLSVDKVVAILDPGAKQGCDFSIFVQCSKNLGSWQGSLFGFPNPLIGLGGFAVPLVMGIAILAGATFARWFWVAFNLGVVFAILFVGFLIGTSVYALHTLCPWCALVWALTIPMFWLVSLYNLKAGNIKVSPRATAFYDSAYGWLPLITLLTYVLVAALFQLNLNVLKYLT
jgi:uncharacterized membrane protein